MVLFLPHWRGSARCSTRISEAFHQSWICPESCGTTGFHLIPNHSISSHKSYKAETPLSLGRFNVFLFTYMFQAQFLNVVTRPLHGFGLIFHFCSYSPFARQITKTTKNPTLFSSATYSQPNLPVQHRDLMIWAPLSAARRH